MTMTLISTVTLGSSAANITFNSIPQTYTDLYLVISGRSSNAAAANNNIQIRPNNSTANGSTRELYGNGSGVGSGTTTDIRAGYLSSDGATSNTFGSSSVYIPNYAGSTNKSISAEGVAEGNITGMLAGINASLWSNTSAITSLVIITASYDFMAGSTASLYGILKGSGGATVS